MERYSNHGRLITVRIEVLIDAWPVGEAKTRLSELIRLAHTEGPQKSTGRGTVFALLLSAKVDQVLAGRLSDFRTHLLSGPKFHDFSKERGGSRR